MGFRAYVFVLHLNVALNMTLVLELRLLAALALCVSFGLMFIHPSLPLLLLNLVLNVIVTDSMKTMTLLFPERFGFQIETSIDFHAVMQMHPCLRLE